MSSKKNKDHRDDDTLDEDAGTYDRFMDKIIIDEQAKHAPPTENSEYRRWWNSRRRSTSELIKWGSK